MRPQDIDGLIPAAGFSSRMGVFKPLLPLGPKTVIEWGIDLFHDQGVADIVVVVGYEAPRIIEKVEALGARWVVNSHYEDDMFSSVKLGVRQLRSPCRAFFLLPVDFPLVRPETITSLMEAFHEGKTDVCRPAYRDRLGHPPLISSALKEGLMRFQGEGGLRSFLSAYQARTLTVECDDPGILLNLNRWEDYEKACELLKDREGDGAGTGNPLET